jgi:SAM-dependent methyltransferase
MVADHFGDAVAHGYDEAEAEMFQPELIARTVGFLAGHADGGPVLEFGIGTGRVALPLARRGLDVHGIDASSAMLGQLSAKPGADSVHVTVGNFARDRVPGTFRLVYLVFNTIMNLTTQAEQVACFRNAAAHLEPGGRFVVEVMIPDLQRLPAGETVRPFTVSPTRLGFDEYDVANQALVSHHYRIEGTSAVALSTPFRYVWPAELDLMAQLAGLALRERCDDWDRTPFTSDSRRHVSVWDKPGRHEVGGTH